MVSVSVHINFEYIVLLKKYGYIALCSESINDYKNDMIISILCDMRMIIGGYLTRDIVSIG